MPNYEYKCKECDDKFEIWQEVGAEAPPCPECAGEVKKVLHAPKLHFKGSGFYITDLAAEKKKAKSSSDAKSEPAAESKETTTETKPEAKSETKSDSPKSESATPAKTETAAV